MLSNTRDLCQIHQRPTVSQANMASGYLVRVDELEGWRVVALTDPRRQHRWVQLRKYIPHEDRLKVCSMFDS